jgi:membrane protein DedA with SNARE-associated domain
MLCSSLLSNTYEQFTKMALFQQLEHTLISYADKVSIEAFVFIGSFVEEVIAPIPSPIVMTVAGSIAQVQHKPILYLLVLSILGALGKTLGASVLYYLSTKAEHIVLSKFGKFIGVSEKEVESIGKHISGSTKDILILTLVRSLPIVPSAPVSVVCGLLKVRFKLFLLATFVGTIIRDAVYLYVGYSGLSFLQSMVSGFSSAESILQGLLVLAFILLFGFLYHRKRKGTGFEDIKKFFGMK